MKTIYRILLLAFVVFFLFYCSQHDSFITSHDEQSRDDDGLVAYYPFNGNADDESGFENNGDIYGATLGEDRFGNPNSAYYFDGEDDYILVPDNNILDISQHDLSISLWMKTGSKPYYELDGNGAGLICKRNTYYANGAGYTLGFNEVYEGCDIVATLGDGSATKKRIDGENCTYNSKWHHVAAIFDRDGYCQLYLDGEPDGPVVDLSSQQGSIANSMDLIIGAYYNGSSTKFYYKGSIDDIRIYNCTLSELEIMELYGYYDPDQIIAYYPFDGSAYDASGNNHNGELFGSYEFVQDRLCNENGAIYFNGLDAYCDFGSNILIDGDFSVHYFIKFTDLSENGYGFYTLAKHQEFNDFSGGWVTMSHTNGCLEFGHYGEGNNHVNTEPGLIAEEGSWYQVVYTYDDCSDLFQIYLDNALVYSELVDAIIFDNDLPLLMAAVLDNGGSPNYFAEIVMDDIGLYNYVLSPEEISEMYHEGGWPDVICGDEIEGSLNINPSNSTENRFEMVTPTGLIDIDILEGEGSHFTYDGLASEISIKVKGQGKTLIINGTEYELSTDYRYTFIGEFEVYLYNARPGNKWNQAKGHWWIDIEGIAESIYPEIE